MAALLCALCTGGCRTTADASAAALQMSATAKQLAEFYAGTELLFGKTDELQMVNQALYGKPYPAEVRAQLRRNEAELAKRAALASDLATVTAQFGKLTESKAPADVAAAAGKLETECDALAGLSVPTPAGEALKSALTAFVIAVQEHKERKAARALDGFAAGLSDLFVREAPVWQSTEQVYTGLASTLAGNLADDQAVDESSVLEVALEPFGLRAATPLPAGMAKGLAAVAQDRIASRKAALDSSYTQSSEAMAASLKEMSRRLHLVAEGRPLRLRQPPLTLGAVAPWVPKVEGTDGR